MPVFMNSINEFQPLRGNLVMLLTEKLERREGLIIDPGVARDHSGKDLVYGEVVKVGPAPIEMRTIGGRLKAVEWTEQTTQANLPPVGSTVIVIRGPRGVIVTPEGRYLIHSWDEVLAVVETEADEEVHDMLDLFPRWRDDDHVRAANRGQA